MSMKTWKAEFLPVSAQDLLATGPTRLQMVEHAILKWEGVRKENLEKHKVAQSFGGRVIWGFVGDGNGVDLGDECALCLAYTRCEGCPLGTCGAEWFAATYRKDVEPMIAHLKKVAEREARDSHKGEADE